MFVEKRMNEPSVLESLSPNPHIYSVPFKFYLLNISSSVFPFQVSSATGLYHFLSGLFSQPLNLLPICFLLQANPHNVAVEIFS